MMKNLFYIILLALLTTDAFSQNKNEELNSRKQKGYYNITQFSLLMGRTQSTHDYRSPDLLFAPSLTMTMGGIQDEHLAIGIGSGFEMFERNLFPLFFDFRYTLRDNEISPFFVFKAGYAFDCSKEKKYNDLYFNNEYFYDVDATFRGGVMVQPETGVKIPLSKNADLLFTVAYRYQQTKLQLNHNSPYENRRESEHKNDMNRLSFGVAIMFR